MRNARCLSSQYVILSPTGTNPDGWLTQGFCAWHDYNRDSTLSGGPVTSPYGDIAFTNLPYITDQGASCGQDFVNGNGTSLMTRRSTPADLSLLVPW